MQKFTIIYTPTIDYHFMQQRPQRLMERFAREGHQVYYLNLNQTNDPPEEVEPNLTVLYSHDDLLRVPKKHPTVLWMSWAKTHEWVEKVNPFLSVYDCLDDFEDWRPYESIIVKKVDLVTTTAESLYEKMKHVHSNVVMVKNACEAKRFDSVETAEDPNDWPLPSSSPFPVIGYVGALGHWVDDELIKKVANSFKVVLIGPSFGMKPIRHPNVSSLGLRDYTTLPSYLKKMDVLMIPFLLNDITNATNPIKMYEYLATGRPVITTALPEALLYKEVYAASTHDQFITYVTEAAQGKFNSPKLVKARKWIAEENSWRSRYATIYKALLNTINHRKL